MPRQKSSDLALGDAATALGVSVDTLRRWDRAGKLRTHRDDRNRRRVPAAEGGGQERNLAMKYRAWSRATATTARRTSRVLRLIAESYERQARQHDADASISSDTE